MNLNYIELYLNLTKDMKSQLALGMVDFQKITAMFSAPKVDSSQKNEREFYHKN